MNSESPTGCGAKTERSLAIKLSGNFARFAYDVAPDDAAKAGARWGQWARAVDKSCATIAGFLRTRHGKAMTGEKFVNTLAGADAAAR